MDRYEKGHLENNGSEKNKILLKTNDSENETSEEQKRGQFKEHYEQ